MAGCRAVKHYLAPGKQDANAAILGFASLEEAFVQFYASDDPCWGCVVYK